MTTLLRRVLALCLLCTPLQAQEVLVWQPPDGPSLLVTSPTAVTALLSAHGYHVSVISTDDLITPGALTPERVALLVVPTRGVFPLEALPAVQEYLRAGGCVLTLGGVPFSRVLARGGDEWRLAEIPTEPPGEVQVIADFEAGRPAGLSRNAGEGEEISWEIVSDDEGRCLRADVTDLQSWQYVVFRVPAANDASLTILSFRARGDNNTPLLGIEANEQDGSRWKYVVPLTPQWREYRIFLPHMLSYASEGRSGEGDFLHAERLVKICFGFTRGMVGEGAHTLWLDDIQRWQFEPSDPRAVPRDTTALARIAKAYGGRYLKMPREQEAPLVRLFAAAERFEGAGIVVTGKGGILAPRQRIPGTWSGWAPRVLWHSGPAYGNVAMAKERTARIVPVLEAMTDGVRFGPAALVVHLHGGELAGGSIGCLCLDVDDVLAEPLLAQVVVGLADYLTRRPKIFSLAPDFSIEGGQAAMTLTATIAAPRDGVATAIFTISDLDGSLRWSETQRITLEEDTRSRVAATAPADHFDPVHYRAAVEVLADGERADRAEFVVDTHATMTALCDWFVARQAEDGGISGIGFMDQRAVRGLLAMYELTGEERYVQSALRWGEHELAIQREDGGYRMGYGVTSRGEACYVADGGEIAIGMARLVSYVPAERRQAYLDSLRDYFRYRESFRLNDGTIAVGWVFHEKYSSIGGDGVREEPFRSDRSFSFVCTCTLAAAAAWQRITGDPADRAMAIHDARWYLDTDVNAASVAGEAAQWAHYFIDDPQIRAGFEERMRETLVPWVGRNPQWWMAAGGRSAITLGVLQYYYTQIDPSPEALVHIMDGVYHMVSPHSPSSVYTVMAKDECKGDEWRYVCYSAAALAEVLEPLVTMRGIAP